MRIERLSTLRLEEFPNLLFVQVHTDEGVTGLGETYFAAASVEAYVHEVVAPLLLGQDATDIEDVGRRLVPYLGFASTGVETRAKSAIDIALWDVVGKATEQPLHALLGGPKRSALRLYNTCAGPDYARRGPQRAVDNWGSVERRPYEDLEAFMKRPGELAASLLEEGITAMKIWPLDPASRETGGRTVGEEHLAKTCRLMHEIRDAVANEIDVMIELHGLWSPSAACKIVSELDAFAPFWYEDPVRPDDAAAVAEVASATETPIATGETLAGRRSFEVLLERRAAGVVIFDVAWCGGLSEGRALGALSSKHGVPFAAHDCTGPVTLTASVHLAATAENVLIQEFVRAFYGTWYPQLVTQLPPVENGRIRPPDGPGLGVALVPGLFSRADATVRESQL